MYRRRFIHKHYVFQNVCRLMSFTNLLECQISGQMWSLVSSTPQSDDCTHAAGRCQHHESSTRALPLWLCSPGICPAVPRCMPGWRRTAVFGLWRTDVSVWAALGEDGGGCGCSTASVFLSLLQGRSESQTPGEADIFQSLFVILLSNMCCWQGSLSPKYRLFCFPARAQHKLTS